MSVLLNNGDGTFAARVDQPPLAQWRTHWSIEAADVTGNARRDLVLAYDDAVVVLINACLP